MEFDKLGFVFTKKAFLANGLDYTDTITGMVKTITLMDSDNILLASEKYHELGSVDLSR